MPAFGMSGQQKFPRSYDRGLIEARPTTRRLQRLPSSRDHMIAASLKRKSIPPSSCSSASSRDHMIAASLKQDELEVISYDVTQGSRDHMIAASLKRSYVRPGGPRNLV